MPQQRRRYPDRSRSYSNSDPGAVFRNQNQNRNQQTSSFSQQQRSSNQQQISFNQQQNSRNQQQSPIKQTQSFAYEPFPTNNNSRSNYQGAVHVIFELFWLVLNIEIIVEPWMFIYFLLFFWGKFIKKLNCSLIT